MFRSVWFSPFFWEGSESTGHSSELDPRRKPSLLCWVNFSFQPSSYSQNILIKEGKMRKVRGFLGGTALALSIISASLIPMVAYGQANPGEPGAGRPRMHRMFGVEAPWVSIALRHQKDLSLSTDQVATLEKIRTDFRDQRHHIQERLR